MIQQHSKEQTLFDKANDAAKVAMQSVVDVAARTNTPVLIFQDGTIKRVEPDQLQQPPVESSEPDAQQEGKASH